MDAVIHLAGAGIADQRWTPARRRVLRDSRCSTTTHLIDGLNQLDAPPGVLLQASAVGFYGDRGDTVLDESASPGSGFLAELSQAWELSGACFEPAGRRCVLRLGAVLGADGGMLQRVLRPFRYGVGGRLGNGKQWFPWISITDVCRICAFLIDSTSMHGPCNACAPAPVPNAIFTQALGTAVSRPTFAAVPAPLLRLALGAMASELLLASQRVVPAQLLEAGFDFKHPTIDAALAHVLRD